MLNPDRQNSSTFNRGVVSAMYEELFALFYDFYQRLRAIKRLFLQSSCIQLLVVIEFDTLGATWRSQSSKFVRMIIDLFVLFSYCFCCMNYLSAQTMKSKFSSLANFTLSLQTFRHNVLCFISGRVAGKILLTFITDLLFVTML